MSPYRLAAIDLDETILTFDGRISDRNRRAVHDLDAAGILPVIASGRMHQATTRFADALGLPGPIISYNGAMLRHRATGDIWHHLTVPPEPAAEIVRFCTENRFHLNYYCDDRLYVAARGHWAEFYVRHTGSPMEAIGDLTTLAGTSPTKMILIDTPETADRLFRQMSERYGGTLYITRTNPEYLEFMHPNANKGEALRILAARLGVARDDVLAFGDGSNDAPMMEWAGFSVAMGSAKEAVKRIASWVAPPFEEDGFAEAVEGILSGRIGRPRE